MGLEVPERRPIAVTGHWLVSALLRNLVFDVAWTAKVLFIDAPPGTGEEIQVIAHELPLSGAIFVTTPQDLAQMHAERTLGLLRECGVPVIGIVHNMASLSCPHCQKVIDLYGQSHRMREPDVHILGRIPFDTRLGVMADRGTPLVLADPQGAIAYEFAMIGGAVRAWLAERDRVEDDVPRHSPSRLRGELSVVVTHLGGEEKRPELVAWCRRAKPLRAPRRPHVRLIREQWLDAREIPGGVAVVQPAGPSSAQFAIFHLEVGS